MFIRPGEIARYLKDKKYLLKGMIGADFGCGGGYFTALLANEVGPEGKIYAIDVQEEVLTEAQEFIKNAGLRNVKFLRQNLEINSGLDSNFLDFVFISQVLFQTKTPENILKEAYRVLKNDGYLIVLEPHPRNLLFANQEVHEIEKLTSIINNLGFKILEKDEKGDYYFVIAQK